MTARNLTLVPPEARAEPATDRLADLQRAITDFRRERVERLIATLIEAQALSAELSEREAGYEPGVIDITAKLLRPLNLAEIKSPGSTPMSSDETNTISKHFVTFLSPGSFVAEDTTREIASWDVDEAVVMARGVTERHGATPYGFRFSTRSRGPDDLDSRVTARSGLYWLGGTVNTLAELEAENDPEDEYRPHEHAHQRIRQNRR